MYFRSIQLIIISIIVCHTVCNYNDYVPDFYFPPIKKIASNPFFVFDILNNQFNEDKNTQTPEPKTTAPTVQTTTLTPSKKKTTSSGNLDVDALMAM